MGVYAGATQAFMAGEDAALPEQPGGDHRLPVLGDRRRRVRRADPRLVPDGHAPARGADHRDAVQPGRRRPAGAAAVARSAVGRADPRAEQPGRRRGPGHGVAARAGQPDAAASSPTWPPAKVDAAALQIAGRGAGGGRRADGQGRRRCRPMEVSDLEDDLGDWLDDHGVDEQLGPRPGPGRGRGRPGLAGRGRDQVPDELISDGLHWVAYALETEQLMNEIEDSTQRISTLVGAAKQYSQLDRAGLQDVVVKEGLISTLIMLGHKLKTGRSPW